VSVREAWFYCTVLTYVGVSLQQRTNGKPDGITPSFYPRFADHEWSESEQCEPSSADRVLCATCGPMGRCISTLASSRNASSPSPARPPCAPPVAAPTGPRAQQAIVPPPPPQTCRRGVGPMATVSPARTPSPSLYTTCCRPPSLACHCRLLRLGRSKPPRHETQAFGCGASLTDRTCCQTKADLFGPR